eukprot:scaffold158669_cov22-Tisochrysis_lutea.AAC.1
MPKLFTSCTLSIACMRTSTTTPPLDTCASRDLMHFCTDVVAALRRTWSLRGAAEGAQAAARPAALPGAPRKWAHPAILRVADQEFPVSEQPGRQHASGAGRWAECTWVPGGEASPTAAAGLQCKQLLHCGCAVFKPVQAIRGEHESGRCSGSSSSQASQHAQPL